MANHPANLKIITWNACSLAAKQMELAEFLRNYKIDIATIIESHLKPNINFHLPDHTIVRLDRSTSRGGGVAVAVRRGLKFLSLRSFNLKIIEAIGIELITTTGPINIIAAYCPYQVKEGDDSSLLLCRDLIALSRNRGKFILARDLNAKHEAWGNLRRNMNGRVLFSDLPCGHYNILCSEEATYFSPAGVPSTLDIFVTNLTNVQQPTVVHELSSDHYPVMIVLGEEVGTRRLQRKNYHRVNWPVFHQLVDAGVIFDHSLHTKEDIDSALSGVEEALCVAREQHVQPVPCIRRDKLFKTCQNKMSLPVVSPKQIKFAGPRPRNSLESIRSKPLPKKTGYAPCQQSLSDDSYLCAQHKTIDCGEPICSQSTVEEDTISENGNDVNTDYTNHDEDASQNDQTESFEQSLTQESFFNISRIPKDEPENQTVPSLKIDVKISMVAMVLITIAIFFSRILTMPSERPHQQTLPKQKHCDNFLKLGSKYPVADLMVWKTLNISVNRAFYRDPGESTTFIFLHNSSAIEDSFLEDIIRVTSECNGGRQPIRLNSADFINTGIAQNHTAFLEQHKKLLEENGILVVQNLDQIPPRDAKVFFTICDSYEPLVQETIIFFTLDVSHQPEYATNSQRSATEIAEKILKKMWQNELNENMLIPLLTRLTDNVFKIGF
ncbi:uncharacterized protein LOC129770968 isoform X2 [Toxorhynchites rutilus septentrionalis]|uniref:uncharacterized protein LOC129770968 isoform X2 n=1 Tax=Toxorhynchites rutilus septentrionalis TaxID=329112 RepID=UPI0024793A50|nr:uncharacterized protein LOC129770968 isoform X2 [Toxorhynchites rutilus septentrionalis]